MSNIVSYKGVFWLLSFSALAVLGNSLSAVAQTAETTTSFQLTESSGTEASAFSSNVSDQVESVTPSVSTQTPVKSTVPSVKPAPVASSVALGEQQFSTSEHETVGRVVTPVPGTIATSSAAFQNQSTPTSQPSTSGVEQAIKPSADRVAQGDINVTPGKATRGGASYVGIAGNVGLSGGSALGSGNFTIISKIGLTNTFSVRPAAVLGDNPVILVPVTYDFNLKSVADPFSEPLPIAPYVGGGVAIKTGDNTDAAFLVSAGIDVPLNRQFTATAAINAAFFSDTDVGLLLGVGYNFRGF